MTTDSPLGSVDKALLALQRLAEAGAEGESLARLSKDLGLNKASLHRTLAALRHRGFAEQDPDSGAYRLGPEMLALADRYLRDSSLRSLLHEPLQQLCAKVGELCHLGAMVGDEVIYLDKVEPQRAIRVWSEIGRRSPAVTTALGRAMLSQSFADLASFKAQYSKPLPMRTAHTPRSAEAIWEQLVAARARGFAVEQQENENGISCLGVAILRAGRPIAAISISALHETMSEERMAALAEELRTTIEPRLPAGLSLQRADSETAPSAPRKSKAAAAA